MKYIAYWPRTAQNDYVKMMEKALTQIHPVEGFESLSQLAHIIAKKGRRPEATIINWVENFVINPKSGRIRPKGVIKALLWLTILRISSQKLIMVRHNRFPHNTAEESIGKAKSLIDFLYLFANKRVTHSFNETSCARETYYVPHPLYEAVSQRDPTLPYYFDRYIVFGRILPYKRLHDLMRLISESTKLEIIGPAPDQVYLRKLQDLCSQNTSIKTGFIANDEIATILRSSHGLVICHAEDNVVVSGSFFFALSLQVPIFAVSTPFLEWVKAKWPDTEWLHVYDDIDSLAAALGKKRSQRAEHNFSEVQSHFQITEVTRSWRTII